MWYHFSIILDGILVELPVATSHDGKVSYYGVLNPAATLPVVKSAEEKGWKVVIDRFFANVRVFPEQARVAWHVHAHHTVKFLYS
jgi:hypothetical protein